MKYLTIVVLFIFSCRDISKPFNTSVDQNKNKCKNDSLAFLDFNKNLNSRGWELCNIYDSLAKMEDSLDQLSSIGIKHLSDRQLYSFRDLLIEEYNKIKSKRGIDDNLLIEISAYGFRRCNVDGKQKMLAYLLYQIYEPENKKKFHLGDEKKDD